MAYLLLAVAVVVMLFGLGKVSRTAQPSRRIPWGPLLLWAVLFGGGLSIWLASARIH
jgi:uncharacterized membrane protein YsdA (DUF1294 family)